MSRRMSWDFHFRAFWRYVKSMYFTGSPSGPGSPPESQSFAAGLERERPSGSWRSSALPPFDGSESAD